jgi:protein involved in polysaccharide export with SLBB domain
MTSKQINSGWSWGLNANQGARALLRLALLFILLVLSGALPAQDAGAPIPADNTVYALGAGDQIHITVHNQDDLSGDYVLDGAGRFTMPLIGVVDAKGLTSSELESVLVNRFRPDYLVNPRIGVEVRFHRPYYIIGEVGRTGAFNYVQGMTYLTAIAIAGGYSYRAKKDVVFVIRGDNQDGEEIKKDVNEKLQPGDIIRVAERRF